MSVVSASPSALTESVCCLSGEGERIRGHQSLHASDIAVLAVEEELTSVINDQDGLMSINGSMIC
jgi:hypothetical protein